MSTQKTGYLEVPGMKGILEAREDGAAIRVGGLVYTMPTSADTLLGLSASSASSPTFANVLTSTTVGTVTTPATTAVVEHGDAADHFTVLTLTNFAVGTVPDNASLGFGASIYTFPAGTILVEKVTMRGGFTGAVSVTTATPEIGLGTVVATGAVSVLSGTATFEDYMDGNASGGTNGTTVAPDIAGTVFYKVGRNNLDYVIKTSGGAARDVFLNVAAVWSDVTAAGAGTFTGTITLKWKIIG